jgi:hypothetical protein
MSDVSTPAAIADLSSLEKLLEVSEIEELKEVLCGTKEAQKTSLCVQMLSEAIDNLSNQGVENQNFHNQIVSLISDGLPPLLDKVTSTGILARCLGFLNQLAEPTD